MKIINWKSVFFILCLIVFAQPILCSEDNEVDSLLAQLSRAEEDTSKVNVLIKLADITSWSDIKSSEKYAKQALQLSQQINYEKGLAYSKFRLALIFIEFDFELTEELILESLEHAQHLKDSLLMARIYNAIGVLKYNLKENDDALLYYNKSLQIYINHNQDSLSAGVYNNLANIYNELSNDSLSKAYFLKAAEINSRTKNFLWLAINYANIGYDLTKTGKLEEGYSYLIKSLDIAENNNFQRVLPAIYNSISLYFFKNREFSESIIYAKLALKIAKEHVNRFKEREALRKLKDAYFEKNDLLNAFKYSELINAATDSINKYNKLKELDLLEMRYHFEEEQKLLQFEKEKAESAQKVKGLIYLSIIVASISGLLLFLLLYVRQKDKHKQSRLKEQNLHFEKEILAKELEFKNKELTTNVMYLLKKNEFITEISNKLRDVDCNTDIVQPKVIVDIISELDKNTSNEVWLEFETRFQEIYGDFYKSLNENFPDLTPNDLKLSAFLKLNMSSKEISAITYQSTETLKTARHRLRKKLGLSREDNLVAFLNQV